MSKKKRWFHKSFKKKKGEFFTGYYQSHKNERVFQITDGKINKTYESHEAAKKAGWKTIEGEA